jgi:hypothetical protein
MFLTKVVCVVFVALGVFPPVFAESAAETRTERACSVQILNARSNGGVRDGQATEDPASGIRWRVAKDPSHPEWPARLVKVSDRASCGHWSAGPLTTQERRVTVGAAQRPIVRPGDSIVVSQDTRAVNAEFDATALSNGWPGDSIKVRLRFGGKVMRVKVTAPGRALLIGDESESNR